MLDPGYADKALHRTEGRAVDHHRAVRLVVGADVFQFEAVGQVVVPPVYGAQLPEQYGIFDHKVELVLEGLLPVRCWSSAALLFDLAR